MCVCVCVCERPLLSAVAMVTSDGAADTNGRRTSGSMRSRGNTHTHTHQNSHLRGLLGGHWNSRD